MTVRTLLALFLSLALGYAQDPSATPVPETIPIPALEETPALAPEATPTATPTPAASSTPVTPVAAGAGGTKEVALPSIKASLHVPQGWYVREQTEEGVTVYQISREKVESESDTFTAGLILSVTTKVPERAEMKPSEYAAELLSATQDDPTEKLKKTTEGAFQVFRTNYQIDADPAPQQMVSVATANDASGTLYFVTWQSPSSEEAKLAPIREGILSSFKFDPTY